MDATTGNLSNPFSQPLCPVDSVRVTQVVITAIARKGDGTAASPIRVLTQIWSMEGRLIAEIDPCPNKP